MAGPHARIRVTSRWSFQATEPAPGRAPGAFQRGIPDRRPVIVRSTLRERVESFVDILSLVRPRQPVESAPLGVWNGGTDLYGATHHHPIMYDKAPVAGATPASEKRSDVVSGLSVGGKARLGSHYATDRTDIADGA